MPPVSIDGMTMIAGSMSLPAPRYSICDRSRPTARLLRPSENLADAVNKAKARLCQRVPRYLVP